MDRRIAIIHAAVVYREWMKHTLEREGFDVGPVTATLEPDALLRDDPDVVILEMDQPENPDDGFRLCAELRLLAPHLIIVFVTDSDYECDRVSAFRVGADEILRKNISGLLLVVRLAALLRRRAALLGIDESIAGAGRDELRIDTAEWSATWRGLPLDLSLTRLKILHRLYRVPGQVCTPSDLMAAAAIHVEPNTISAHIKAIRDEFRRLDPGFDHIRAERSIGYRWVTRCGPEKPA